MYGLYTFHFYLLFVQFLYSYTKRVLCSVYIPFSPNNLPQNLRGFDLFTFCKSEEVKTSERFLNGSRFEEAFQRFSVDVFRIWSLLLLLYSALIFRFFLCSCFNIQLARIQNLYDPESETIISNPALSSFNIIVPDFMSRV